METPSNKGPMKDPEKFIGENLINKIGIGILVLGLAYFVKYAIDQSWIGQGGQVAGGLFSGALLIGIGHWLHQRYRAFSSVLAGGGIAISYITLYLGFTDYELYSPAVAFAGMVAITAVAVGLSLLYDRQELTIVALLGGIATPFLANSGSSNTDALLTYLALLNSGILAVSWFKRWRTTNLITFLGTLIIFGGIVLLNSGGWYHLGTGKSLLFATIFYLQFGSIALMHNLRTASKFKALELFLYLSNTFFYYACCMYLLPMFSERFLNGYFTAALAVVHIALAFGLSRHSGTDRNLLMLMVGLAVSLVSLVAPVHFHGNAITLFWAAEAALLLYMWGRTGFRFFRWSGHLIAVLTLLSLSMDWGLNRLDMNSGFFAHPVYLTNWGVAIVLGAVYFLFRRFFPALKEQVKVYLHLAGIVLYFGHVIELNRFLGFLDQGFQFSAAAFLCFHLAIFLPVQWKASRSENDIFQMGSLLWACVVLMVGWLIKIEWASTYSSASWLSMVLHYTALGLSAIATLHGVKALHFLSGKNGDGAKVGHWLLAFGLVAHASLELDYLLIQLFAGKTSIVALMRHSHLIGYPVVWGLLAFGLLLWGMRQQIRHVRIIGLTVFGVILLKLFLFDVQSMSEAGRIVAFIALGVLLLVVSFLYQKLRHLILTEDTDTTPTTPTHPEHSVVESAEE
ncbi:MAG: DUF2339 domain-containing protein [Salibacteraceae bacterium]